MSNYESIDSVNNTFKNLKQEIMPRIMKSQLYTIIPIKIASPLSVIKPETEAGIDGTTTTHVGIMTRNSSIIKTTMKTTPKKLWKKFDYRDLQRSRNSAGNGVIQNRHLHRLRNQNKWYRKHHAAIHYDIKWSLQSLKATAVVGILVSEKYGTDINRHRTLRKRGNTKSYDIFLKNKTES